MMKTEFTDILSDDVRIVGASNGGNKYILWQKTDSEQGQVYFEYDSQNNSGYNIVQEIMLDNDGCHLVLKNAELVHFYWNSTRHSDLSSFVAALKSLYFHEEIEIDDLR